MGPQAAGNAEWKRVRIPAQPESIPAKFPSLPLRHSLPYDNQKGSLIFKGVRSIKFRHMSSDHDEYMERDDGNENEIVANASGPLADPSALSTDNDTSKTKWAWNTTNLTALAVACAPCPRHDRP